MTQRESSTGVVSTAITYAPLAVVVSVAAGAIPLVVLWAAPASIGYSHPAFQTGGGGLNLPALAALVALLVGPLYFVAYLVDREQKGSTNR